MNSPDLFYQDYSVLTSTTFWDAYTDVSLMEIHFNSPEKMIISLQKKFNVDKFLIQYNTYLDNILDLKKKYNFQYINLYIEYFADPNHLNDKGSKLVSIELTKKIKEKK